MSRFRPGPKHLHLLPILSFVPLLMALLAVTQFGAYLEPIVVAIVATGYLTINIIYRLVRGTLQISYIVEYSLISLLTFLILSLYA